MIDNTTARHCADCGGEVSDFSAADLCTDHDGMGYAMGYRLLSGDPDGDGEPGVSWCLAALKRSPFNPGKNKTRPWPAQTLTL